ncbi:MAG: helicase associated domain-containing protein, partial [Bacteroidota bacterium]|nr:helicase associated domain-containing protein [Bacteroidota bacterium]
LHQRTKKNKFKQDQKKLLENIHFFEYKREDLTFNSGIILLDNYIAIHDSANVSQLGKDRKLGRWVNLIRQKKKLDKLTNEQIAQLEKRNFFWEAKKTFGEARFDKRVAELKAYKEKVGDFKVPYKYPENKALYNWYNKLLRKRPSPERYKKLLAIGFDWEMETKNH